MNNRFDILAIEDSPSDQVLIRHGFEAAGLEHTIHFAENGIEAMAFMQRTGLYAHAPRPQLILLDLNMTRKDGREILAELKKVPEFAAIPIVVFSTSSESGEVELCYRLGANAFVIKPHLLEEFIDAIGSIARFWLQKVAHVRSPRET